ncbi:MAG TPA: DUF6600 domain-containing protein, partial [Candidatus Angelobacter sp.]|nr:DUF6600 domain-containing protein [Candidatus Angelobacter sp.]
YGRWVDAPGYGQVWSPSNVDPGWAPYQTGRWVWQPYYGWTWVSYEPWGWAPYHYGRWFVNGGSWCWWPGPVYVHYRPLWAPAYVFFLGFGHHHGGFGFGFGSIGWLPIGPFDPFYGWYGRGFGRFHAVAFADFRFHDHHGFVAPLGIHGRHPFVSNTSLAFTNARVRGGITTVPAGDFGRGVMTGRHSGVQVSELRQSQAVTGNVGIVPTRESLHSTVGGPSGRPTTVQPRNTGHFFVKNTPPSGPPAFRDQAAHVQQVVQGRGTGPSFSGGPASGSAGGQASGGARLSGGPGSGSAGGQATGPKFTGGPTSGSTGAQTSGGNGQPTKNGDGRTGWHSFGSGQSSGSGQGQAQGQGQGQGGGRQIDSGRKPPLELSKPIVQPRPGDTRATSQPSYTPRYTPPANQPRYTPPANQPRYTPPASQPRYTPPAPSHTPPSYSGGHGSSGGGSRGGGSSSGRSSGGSSGRSSGSSSHSSSSHSGHSK